MAMAPKILKSTLFIVNCSDCLSAEFVRHASTPYNKISRHLDVINEVFIDLFIALDATYQWLK